MKKFLVVLGILLVIVFIFGSYLQNLYNGLVRMDETVKASWAQVENQLQRRYDLIPNYVEVVKGYAAQEKEIFTRIADARARIGSANTVAEKISANNELTSALSRLLVIIENYPTLKSNENFIRLQDELAGTENRISVERMRYNEQVQQYNIKVRSFPTNIFAGMFGFEKATFFEVPPEAKEAPKIKF